MNARWGQIIFWAATAIAAVIVIFVVWTYLCERKLPCLADRPIAVGGDHLANRVGLPLWASLEAEIYMGTATVLSALCQKRTSTTSFDHLVAAAPGYVGTVSSF